MAKENFEDKLRELISRNSFEDQLRDLKLSSNEAMESAEMYFAQAAELYHKMDYKAAEKALREVIRLDYDCAAAHNNLGRVLEENGDLDEAEQEYQIAIDLNPHDIGYKGNLAYVIAEKGEIDKSIEMHKELIDVDPDNSFLYNNLGSVYLMGWALDEGGSNPVLDPHLSKSKDTFEKAIKCDYNNSNAHANLAWTLNRQGNVDKAIIHYTIALNIDPENRKAKDNIKKVLKKKEKKEKRKARLKL